MRKLFCLFFFLPSLVFSQHPFPPRHSGEILQDIRQLRVLGSVLYVAAHPDDENTRLITWLANEQGYRTAYLSLTRGDGGQNLIGAESETYLGILRTQELLAARRTDGAEQWFSRAFDFGYSKTPEETFNIWEKPMVLADVVWAIRKFRPDVIITRFPGPEKGGGGHGHHTGSAMLAQEAFHLAADPNAFPEQLAFVQPWQPRRLLWNSWRINDKDPGVIAIDIGGFNPLLGKSYGEIASEARSMHRCQAFGVAPQRGTTLELLMHEKGDTARNELFEGIDASWNRIGETKLDGLLQQLEVQFNPWAPEKSLPGLLQIRKLLQGKTGYWYDLKRAAVDELIIRCAGVWVELTGSQALTAPGDSLTLTAAALARGNTPVKLVSLDYGNGQPPLQLNQALEANVLTQFKSKFLLPAMPPSQPYWLQHPGTEGYFDVKDQNLIGRPENPPVFEAKYVFEIGDQQITWKAPAIYKYVDRSRGELYQPLYIAPPLVVNLAGESFVFGSNEPKVVTAVAKSFLPNSQMRVKIKLPSGWRAEPEVFNLAFIQREQETSISFTLFPPANASDGKLTFELEEVTTSKEDMAVGSSQALRGFRTISYDHIPTQVVFPAAEARLVKMDLKVAGKQIGYIMGSGDELPAYLRSVGYEVTLLKDEDINPDNLRRFQSVIVGIRAYNTRERMPFLHPVLMDYVKEGGVCMVQYNTTFDLKHPELGPFPLSLSRDRVTEEDCAISLIDPKHPLLNLPNKITEKDFEGWVQERGLYYPGTWDDRYKPLLRMADTNEKSTDGAILVATHGKGRFVYTGISWFRQLPAGVPGAYRLLANLISPATPATTSGR